MLESVIIIVIIEIHFSSLLFSYLQQIECIKIKKFVITDNFEMRFKREMKWKNKN